MQKRTKAVGIDNSRIVKILLIGCPLLFFIGLTCLLMVVSGTANPFISCFSVDNSDRLYVGYYAQIAVYDNGTLINAFPTNTTRPYMFSLTDDGAVVLTSGSNVDIIDPEGNILDTYSDPGAAVYNELKSSRFRCTSPSGDTYTIKNFLGITKIVKNKSEVVYQISTASIIAKMLLYVFVLIFITTVYLVMCIVLDEKTIFEKIRNKCTKKNRIL